MFKTNFVYLLSYGIRKFAKIQQNCNKITGSGRRRLRSPGNKFIAEQNVSICKLAENLHFVAGGRVIVIRLYATI